VSSGVTDSYTISPLPAVPPTFSEAAGSYTGNQSIYLQTSSGSLICYNTTGAPTITAAGACGVGSMQYVSSTNTPVVVSATETLYAIAGGLGYTNSAVSSATYTISGGGGGGSLGTALTPTFSEPAGTYPAAENVTLTSSNNALICVSVGGTPTITAGVCGGSGTLSHGTSPYAITVSASGTVTAIAGGTNYVNSAPESEAYVIE
jgi:hypothetical protein